MILRLLAGCLCWVTIFLIVALAFSYFSYF